MNDAISQFRDAIQSRGLPVPEAVEDDGKLHRFSTNGKLGDDSGWYVYHGDGIPAGAFGCWRSDISETWRADIGRKLTLAEEAAHRSRVESIRREREVEERKRREAAALKASEIWKSAIPATSDNPYLSRKRVSSVASLRELDASTAAEILGYAPKSKGEPLTGLLLAAPVKVGNALATLEMIDGKGRKSALYGGAKAGGYWAAQPLPDGGAPDLRFMIAEGVATGLSAREATGHPVIAALSSGNLSAVAKAMRERYPAAVLVILADLIKTTGKPDPHAVEAARAVGGLMAIPSFTSEEIEAFQAKQGKPPKDINDLAQIRGAEGVRDAIALAKPPEPKGGAEHEPGGAVGGQDIGGIIEAAITKLAEDAGAVFEPDVLAVLTAVRRNNPADWQRYRKRIKDAAGGIVSELDRLTRVSGNDEDETPAKGRKVDLYEPEPWPDPVDGAEVLDAAFDAIKRHMFIIEEYAITTTLWVAHSHVFDVFSHTPRLGVSAPREDCGKTRLLFHLVGSLTTKPQTGDLMRAAPFFRMSEEFKPTWLIDEIDVFIKDDSELLAALNNGWEPHGGVPRCVGEDFEVRIFRTHSPVAFGGVRIEKVLPATTLSRTLVIPLQRATKGEIAEDFDVRKHRDGLLEIGRKLSRWCGDNRF